MNPVLQEHLAYLKLADIAAQFEPLATDAAAKGWPHVEYLRRLLEGECRARQQRAIERRVLAARFPVLKTLDQFRWDWPKKINELQVNHHEQSVQKLDENLPSRRRHHQRHPGPRAPPRRDRQTVVIEGKSFRMKDERPDRIAELKTARALPPSFTPAVAQPTGVFYERVK